MTDLSKGAAWIGGHIIPIADAAIPVTDWGVTHSDIAYDVVPVWQGGFFRLDDYVARFRASLTALRFDIGMDASAVCAALHRMVAASGMTDAYVAMVAARGRNPVPGSRDPRDCENHFYAWCVPYVHIVKPEAAAKGTTVWIAKSVRRIPQDSVDPTVKNYHWGDFTSGLFEAKDRGYETTLLLDHAGHVTEGPVFKRWKPRARGGAAPNRKRTSHINVILSNELGESPAAPVQEAEEAPKPAAKKTAAKKKAKSAATEGDDLKMISGVGPKLEAKLHEEGITTYEQILAWTEDDMVEFGERLSFKDRIQRDDWQGQVKILIEDRG